MICTTNITWVAEDIFISTVQPRHIVNFFNWAVHKYSYLLTYFKMFA